MINKILSVFLGAIALLGLPALFGGLFQSNEFCKNLKPALEKEANQTLSDLTIQDGETTLEKLDATLSGIAPDEATRENARTEVDNLKGIRVKKEDNLIQVINQLTITKTDANINFSGLVDNKTSTYTEPFSKNLSGFTLQHDHLREEEYVLKSDYVNNPSFGKWVTQFLQAPGDRGIEVVGQQLTLTGEATQYMEKKWLADLTFLGFQPHSKLQKIQPTAGNLHITKQGTRVTATGDIPQNYPVNKLNKAWKKNMKASPFTEISNTTQQGPFFSFIQNYFQSEGDRSLELKGNNLLLKGDATPFMNQRWTRKVSSLGFNTTNNQELYPSFLLFPTYRQPQNSQKQSLIESLKPSPSATSTST